MCKKWVEVTAVAAALYKKPKPNGRRPGNCGVVVQLPSSPRARPMCTNTYKTQLGVVPPLSPALSRRGRALDAHHRFYSFNLYIRMGFHCEFAELLSRVICWGMRTQALDGDICWVSHCNPIHICPVMPWPTCLGPLGTPSSSTFAFSFDSTSAAIYSAWRAQKNSITKV